MPVTAIVDAIIVVNKYVGTCRRVLGQESNLHVKYAGYIWTSYTGVLGDGEGPCDDILEKRKQ